MVGTSAQAVDFNISTQLTDLRSSGSDNNPGFNPCRGGARAADGTCGGPAVALNGTAAALLDLDNLQTIFPSLGPGAVTDNMFGLVSGADATPAASGGPIPVTACGKVTNASLAGLNCGDLRFDPGSQGQPFSDVTFTGANTLVTPAGGLNMNTQFIADFCPGGATVTCDNGSGAQKSAAHTGFNIANNFNFQFLTGTTGVSSGTDNVRQVTAVKTTGIGTEGTPGTGDQIVVVNASWATTAANPSSNNPASSPTNLTVNWTQNISDPDQSGTGSGSFVQNISGSFVYHAPATPAISAQYPNGKTQTERSIGVAAPVGETLDFIAVP